MKLFNSSYTGRAARSLEDAFGPYTSKHISEPDHPMDWQDVVVLLASIAVGIVFATCVFWGLV